VILRRVTLAFAFVATAGIACGKDRSAPAARTAAPATSTSAGSASVGPKGTVTTRTFHSAALGVDKDYVVYLPAGYDAQSTTRWPVLYYLHGLGGNETNWVKHGKLAETADAIALAAIVVMPDGDDGFYADSPRALDYDACMKDGTGLLVALQPHAKTCVRHHAYETYIVKDLIDDVDATYRTLASRDGRGIAGMSMGGFGALELAMRHLDRFAAAASHSGVDSIMYGGPHPYAADKVALMTDTKELDRIKMPGVADWLRGIFTTDLATWRSYDPATLADKLAPGALALYLDCGTDDGLQLDDSAKYLHDVLTAHHLEHEFFLGPGGHDFAFWAPRLPFSLRFLAAHVAKPHA